MGIGNQLVVWEFFYELVKQADGVDVIFASLKSDGQSKCRVFCIIFGRVMASSCPVRPWIHNGGFTGRHRFTSSHFVGDSPFKTVEPEVKAIAVSVNGFAAGFFISWKIHPIGVWNGFGFRLFFRFRWRFFFWSLGHIFFGIGLIFFWGKRWLLVSSAPL